MKGLQFKVRYLLSMAICNFAILLPGLGQCQVVNSWITSNNQSKLLQEQPIINLSKTVSNLSLNIKIDTTISFQTMDGFGYTFTEGSAEVISKLSPKNQNDLLNELFNPVTGLGISVLRISIGASDLSASPYTYDDLPAGAAPDTTLKNFSLTGPDMDFMIPMLKKILAIHPDIKILGTPWTAPRWMKTYDSWSGGLLSPKFYAVYAAYFVKYLDAMKALGINLWAITVQNEPENSNNEPSMVMTANQQITFINNNLGPAFQKAGYTTKIIAYDHNCIDTAFPISVLKNSNYVDGAAFHLYQGDISALTQVHDSTHKNVYFTEQFTGVSQDFSGLSWHMSNVMIGAANNWAKIALEWNLATDANYGPFTPSGCKSCMGALTINNNVVTSRNLSYYVAGHMSKVVKPGARRIHSTTNTFITYVVFKNPDGSIALVAMNNGSAAFSINVISGDGNFDYTIPVGSVASIIWGGPARNPMVIGTPNQKATGEVNKPIQIPVTISGGAASKFEFYSDTTLLNTSTAAPYVLNYTYALPGDYMVTCKVYDSLGKFANSMPIYVHIIQYKLVPGTFKAANFDNMNGARTETCQDAGGGLDMGYLSKDGFMDYCIDVKTSGRYRMDARVAGFPGSFQFYIGSNPISSVISTPSTGDYQIWQTKSDSLILHKGRQVLRLKIVSTGSGWNLNTLKFSLYDSITGIHDLDRTALQIITYPNPYNESIFVQGDFGAPSKISVHLMNAFGDSIKPEDYSYNMNATSTVGLVGQIEVNTRGLASGVYFLRIQKEDQIYVKKIVKS